MGKQGGDLIKEMFDFAFNQIPVLSVLVVSVIVILGILWSLVKIGIITTKEEDGDKSDNLSLAEKQMLEIERAKLQEMKRTSDAVEECAGHLKHICNTFQDFESTVGELKETVMILSRL